MLQAGLCGTGAQHLGALPQQAHHAYKRASMIKPVPAHVGYVLQRETTTKMNG